MNSDWKYAIGVDVSRDRVVVLEGVMFITLVYGDGAERDMHSKRRWYPGRNLNYFLEDFELQNITSAKLKFVAETEPVLLDSLLVMQMRPFWAERRFCTEKRPAELTNSTWFSLPVEC